MNYSCNFSTTCARRRSTCHAPRADNEAVILAMLEGKDIESADDDTEEEQYQKPMNKKVGDPLCTQQHQQHQQHSAANNNKDAADEDKALLPGKALALTKTTMTDHAGGVKAENESAAFVENFAKASALTRQVSSDSSSKAPTWARTTPFTTSHGSLTSDQLRMSEKQHARHAVDAMVPSYSAAGMVGGKVNNNWGEMGFGSLSSSESDSDESFGASMYEDRSNPYQEIDRYNQRPRRRASLDKTCYNIAAILKEGGESGSRDNAAKKKTPNFVPATNCNIASDFIVRCFCVRLRHGMTVIKHNRSRWSKSQLRILYLCPDGRTLSWKPLDGEDKGKRPKLDLMKAIEVRHAYTRDPETKKQLGTSVMRKRCKDGSANKSFALIFAKRTLDMTAMSSDQCRVLMEGFSALCFRLQYDKIQEDGLESDSNSRNFTSRSIVTDDWESTVYGGESTVSMTQTATSGTAQTPTPSSSPWGL